jgi:hypothetical protein
MCLLWSTNWGFRSQKTAFFGNRSSFRNGVFSSVQNSGWRRKARTPVILTMKFSLQRVKCHRAFIPLFQSIRRKNTGQASDKRRTIFLSFALQCRGHASAESSWELWQSFIAQDPSVAETATWNWTENYAVASREVVASWTVEAVANSTAPWRGARCCPKVIALAARTRSDLFHEDNSVAEGRSYECHMPLFLSFHSRSKHLPQLLIGSDRLYGLVVSVPGCKTRGPGLDSRCCQILWVAVCLKRGPLSLVRINEELLEGKVAVPV